MRWLESQERHVHNITLCKLISNRTLDLHLRSRPLLSLLKEIFELLPEGRERCISVYNHCYSTVVRISTLPRRHLHRHPFHFLQGPVLPHVFSFELLHFVGEVGPENLAKAVH